MCQEDLCLVGGGLGNGQALSLQCLIWLCRFSTSSVNFLIFFNVKHIQGGEPIMMSFQ